MLVFGSGGVLLWWCAALVLCCSTSVLPLSPLLLCRLALQVAFALMVVTAPALISKEGGGAYAYNEEARVQGANFAPLL